jgi:hypothetical protein
LLDDPLLEDQVHDVVALAASVSCRLVQALDPLRGSFSFRDLESLGLTDKGSDFASVLWSLLSDLIDDDNSGTTSGTVGATVEELVGRVEDEMRLALVAFAELFIRHPNLFPFDFSDELRDEKFGPLGTQCALLARHAWSFLN